MWISLRPFRVFSSTYPLRCNSSSPILLRLRSRNLLLIRRPTPKPPTNNQNWQRSNHHTRVIHVRDRNRHRVREAEEHNREREPANRHAVDQEAPSAHVKCALVHVSSAREQIRDDGNEVRDVVDRNSRSKHSVEGRGASEVNASERCVGGRNEQLSVERDLEARVDARPGLGEWHGVVTSEGPEDARSGKLRGNNAGSESDEDDECEAKRAAGGLCGLAEELGEREAGVGGGEGAIVLDAEHEADEVSQTSAEGDGEGDADG